MRAAIITYLPWLLSGITIWMTVRRVSVYFIGDTPKITRGEKT